MENDNNVLLSLQNVDVTFKGFKAVSNVSLDIYKGEIFSLVGESGSGKTTLGRAIMRINSLENGKILFHGEDISKGTNKSINNEIIKKIQMVFQDPASSLNDRATVDYIISEGLYNFKMFKSEEDRLEKVKKILADVGLLEEHLSRYPHEFSGGQRQRIGIARAMIMEPELLIADEPISALDVSVRAQILNLIKKFKEEKKLTCLFIAHDLSIVRYISDRIGVIYKGNIVEIAPAEELFKYPMHPYTKSLLSAIPIPDPILEKSKRLYIYNPLIHDYSFDKPKLVDIGNNHFVYGNDKEIEEYKKIRNENIPIKINEIENDECVENNEDNIEEMPLVNIKSGNRLLFFISLMLPLIGIILIPILKKNNSVKSYYLVKKGTIIGFASIGIFLLLICMLLIIVSIR